MNDLKKFDLEFLRHYDSIAGVHEAGRGPLAGPVVAAAVIFERETFIPEVNDSKRISENKREALFETVLQNALSYGIGIVYPKTIDEINILQATLQAMETAVENLAIKPSLILVDGNKVFKTTTEIRPVIKGDSKSFSIAAASIIAKVTRDRIMRDLALEFPQYSWHKNKGYGTKEHIEAIRKFGATEIHRKSFLSKIFEPK